MTRQAYHDRQDAVFFRGEARDLRGSTLRPVAVEGRRPQHADRPREGAGRIADRHPDSPLTDIETDNTHGIILSPFPT